MLSKLNLNTMAQYHALRNSIVIATWPLALAYTKLLIIASAMNEKRPEIYAQLCTCPRVSCLLGMISIVFVAFGCMAMQVRTGKQKPVFYKTAPQNRRKIYAVLNSKIHSRIISWMR